MPPTPLNPPCHARPRPQVWTHQERAALVMVVSERQAPLSDAPKIARLRQMLEGVLGWAAGEGRVEVEMVRGGAAVSVPACCTGVDAGMLLLLGAGEAAAGSRCCQVWRGRRTRQAC